VDYPPPLPWPGAPIGPTPHPCGREDLHREADGHLRDLLADALEAGATDLHLEPRSGRLVVRLRVDGVLGEHRVLPPSWARPLVERLKGLAGLALARQRLPQIGRMESRIGGERIGLSVATAPTLEGEEVVLRILRDREPRTLEELDLSDRQLARIEGLLESRSGLILTTGPPRSGRTTALYAMLDRIGSAERKVVTLEDPVAFELEGASQIAVDAGAGLGFAAGLRAALHQDADVILVGEIRDRETAQLAVRAALCGHLVLSSLETADAIEAVARLIDLGAEPYLLAEGLRGVVAQRLVGRPCPHCSSPVRPSSQLLACVSLDSRAEGAFREGAGCDRCRGSGLSGLVALHEIMTVTADLAREIRRGAWTEELRCAARDAGWVPLAEDGLAKARDGSTTLQEVILAVWR